MVRVKVSQSYNDVVFVFDDARSAAAFMDVVIGTAEKPVKITVEEIEVKKEGDANEEIDGNSDQD